MGFEFIGGLRLIMLLKLRRLWEWLIVYSKNEYTIAEFYRKYRGVKIGNNCRIMGKTPSLFGGEPYLVELENNVTIAGKVSFITHDSGVGIFRKQYPGLNVFGRIHICSNCFIGIKSIILPGVIIGPNSVVGAGAVVTKDVPPGTVVAGVPARVIMTTDSYLDKVLAKAVTIDSERDKKKQVLEAIGE